MKKITIETSHPYDVCISRKLLSETGKILKERFSPCTVAIVSDTTVAKLYLSVLENSLSEAGFKCCSFVFPTGESNKNLSTYGQLAAFLSEQKISRGDLIIALGGGVTGDLAGFAAATYLRGIAWVQIPTTLLAAVDASVGGKTGIDLPSGKNLLGAFHQPSLVLCDCDCLLSLEAEQIQDGVAEMIKHGAIADISLFRRLHKKLSIADSDIEELICRNIEIKRQYVLADEHDCHQRQLLNFGHTIGHAIEKCSNYQLSHGQAVAIGMCCELRAARRLGLSQFHENELQAVVQEQSLPFICEFSVENIWAAALNDKKRSGERINLVILPQPGAGELISLNMQDLRRFVELALEVQ